MVQQLLSQSSLKVVVGVSQPISKALELYFDSSNRKCQDKTSRSKNTKAQIINNTCSILSLHF